MNLLIFDQWESGRLSAISCLKGQFDRVVCVGNLEELLRIMKQTFPQIHLALFVVPSIFIGRDGTVFARSNRAEDILEVTKTCSRLHIPHVIFPSYNKFPAYFDRRTKERIPDEVAFWRKFDFEAGTFEGCIVGRDWNEMLNLARDILAKEESMSLS